MLGIPSKKEPIRGVFAKKVKASITQAKVAPKPAIKNDKYTFIFKG